MNKDSENNTQNQPDNNARINLDKAPDFVAGGAGKLEQLMEKATELARQKKSRPASYYTRFLSRAVLLEESGPPRAIVSTVGIISLFLFGVITWAAVTTLNETSVATGQIRPASTIQPVQHLEGGIVAKVLVKEGDEVKKGQTILTLAPTAALANLDRINVRHTALSLQIIRLKAFSANKTGDFSRFEKDHPLLAQDQRDILQQQNKSRTAQQQVILAQLDARRNELLLLDRQELTEKRNLEIIAEEMSMRQELTDKGLGSKIRLLEVQRSHNKAEGDLIQTQSRKAGVRAMIAQVKGDLVALNERFRNESLIQVDSLSSERAEISAELTQLNDRVKRLAILSPADGIVKGLKYQTTGSVVPPGDLVAEIVPLSDILVAEVRISPRDIGHVNVGTEVLLKIDTYNYARYGSITSNLNHVSASSFLDERGDTYFKGLIELPHNYIGTDPKSNRITSGMTVVADIQTGKKTLLQYLVKPINNALDTSFRER
ncbi:MAG: HlyD family type I secretion periplasmic adaptor subunit [Emcibacter sp.]|nr:HlyD family type I secretion periplasmic adaptor subunit [Emcibacter sp.]